MIGKVNDLLGDLFVAFHSHRRTSAQPATEQQARTRDGEKSHQETAE